jgi:hypothetical protein
MLPLYEVCFGYWRFPLTNARLATEVFSLLLLEGLFLAL